MNFYKIEQRFNSNMISNITIYYYAGTSRQRRIKFLINEIGNSKKKFI
jgi:hypothetical protein